jgi:predicted transposase/invertase (TIGR01784 family)
LSGRDARGGFFGGHNYSTFIVKRRYRISYFSFYSDAIYNGKTLNPCLSMETDSLFYRLFKEKPKLLFELLGEKIPRTAYTFGSYEVKQTSLRSDGILEPVRSTKSPIFFLENQGYLDRKNEFYPSFFTKIFLYLRDSKPPNDWRAVIMFTQRKYDPGVPIHYCDFVVTNRLQRIYLDELPPEMGDLSLEMGLLQLIGLKDAEAPDRAKVILDQTYQQTSDVAEQRRVLEWILTVLVHKFSKLSREEIAAMLGVTKELRESRFYKDIKEEGKEEGKEEAFTQTIPLLLQAGFSVEEIAKQCNISAKQVETIAKSRGIEV